jgi:hypothetical protein
VAARRDDLKRWIQSERTRSRLRTIGFAAIYSRARYLGVPEENLVAVPPGREVPQETRLAVENLLRNLAAGWLRESA